MMHPLPSISQVYRLFAQEERHKEISQLTTQTDAMAFVADKRRFNPSTSRNSNFQKMSFTNTGNARASGKTYTKPAYFCNHCKIPGHSMERCFKLNGYPPGFQSRKDVAFSHSDQTQDSPNDLEGSSQTVSLQQYNQLLEMYNKQHVVDSASVDFSANASSSNDKDNSKHALLASTLCLFSSFNSHWLIDSGATDHILPRFRMF